MLCSAPMIGRVEPRSRSSEVRSSSPACSRCWRNRQPAATGCRGARRYAATDLVDVEQREGIEPVREALNAILRPPINVVRTWDGWKSELKDGPRSLLVIICHTAEKRSSSGPVVQFEIGGKTAKEWLAVNRVKPPYVVGTSKPTPSPTVSRIGCSTALRRVPFQDPVGRFQLAGAPVVLSTMSTVLGRHAAKVTAGVIERLEAVVMRRRRPSHSPISMPA
jgi:hypothetical protein